MMLIGKQDANGRELIMTGKPKPKIWKTSEIRPIGVETKKSNCSF